MITRTTFFLRERTVVRQGSMHDSTLHFICQSQPATQKTIV
jgi:hypothetical protein